MAKLPGPLLLIVGGVVTVASFSVPNMIVFSIVGGIMVIMGLIRLKTSKPEKKHEHRENQHAHNQHSHAHHNHSHHGKGHHTHQNHTTSHNAHPHHTHKHTHHTHTHHNQAHHHTNRARFCPHCGGPINSHFVFCPNCGARLK